MIYIFSSWVIIESECRSSSSLLSTVHEWWWLKMHFRSCALRLEMEHILFCRCIPSFLWLLHNKSHSNFTISPAFGYYIFKSCTHALRFLPLSVLPPFLLLACVLLVITHCLFRPWSSPQLCVSGFLFLIPHVIPGLYCAFWFVHCFWLVLCFFGCTLFNFWVWSWYWLPV